MAGNNHWKIEQDANDDPKPQRHINHCNREKPVGNERKRMKP
jgi:hypothetical protein